MEHASLNSKLDTMCSALMRYFARHTIEGLESELAIYKHAFVTTAADRDQLQARLSSLGEMTAGARPDQSAPQIDETSTYGRYWQGPTEHHRELLDSLAEKSDTEVFRALILTGFVLQHALARKREHIGRLIAWQIETLAKAGVDFTALDAAICELDILPDELIFNIAGRRLSTDFVRYYEYFNIIKQTLTLPKKPLIVEIGAGYGGLARILRLHHPDSSLLLLDIAETLTGTELYLRHAFPEFIIRYFSQNDPRPPQPGEIVLCRIEEFDLLKDLTIDLAVNTWSFGEMPNRYIDQWFRFLNERNTTKSIFLLNHFMMQVCLELNTARAQLQSANWLSRVDARWDVVKFEMHPGSHHAPYWRHCHQGLCVVGKLFVCDADRRRAMDEARAAARDVHLEDWAQFSVDANSTEVGAQDRRIALLSKPDALIDETTVFNLTQVETVLGLMKDDIRRDESSAFFRLWNDYRLNGSLASLRLLRILLYIKWRPAVKNPSNGKAYSVISGEDYEFGTLVGNSFAGDPGLIVPKWLEERLAEIFALAR